jgi:hypothetical protein
MIDMSNAPPEIQEYARGLRGLTNHQLWAGIDEELTRTSPESPILDYQIWMLRAEITELRRRLSAWASWLDGELQPLPAFTPEPHCTKCGNSGPKRIRTAWCPGGAQKPEAVCFIRPDAQGEHMHRACEECGYEWLEACTDDAGPWTRRDTAEKA